jgi:predicted ATPase
MGALLSYRLPPFIALNEPETSLHPSLLPAGLASSSKPPNAPRSGSSPIRELADALAAESGVLPREVIRKDGATWLEGLTQLGEFDDD